MFTVCPKCALTLVVTPADLRVAQGYVRCGRCSNVFNAIVALSEDRQGGAGSGSQSSTASTSVIRKAPSIAEQEPPHDPLSDTGETEAIYAEPDLDRSEAAFQEVFVEAPATAAGTTTSSSPSPAEKPAPGAPEKSTRAPEASAQPAAAEGADDADSIPDVALEFDPQATDVSKVFVEAPPAKKIDLRQATGTFERVTLESGHEPSPPAQQPRDADDVALDDELRTLAARLEAAEKSSTPRPGAADASPAAMPDAANEDATPAYHGSPYNSADNPANAVQKSGADSTRRGGLATSGARTGSVHESRDAQDGNEARASAVAAALTEQAMPRGRKLAWIGGLAALALLLAAQAINHNRHDLATNARLNRPLTRFYAAIGVPLVPRWNLASYEVRQLGAFSGGDSGTLTVRASLKNTTDQPLPLPLLRITVQDRYGNRIATRDVAPKSYVPGAVPNDAHLGASQRIDAEMTFTDPGRDAVGFEIDACLPRDGGNIACANDAPAAPR